MHKYKMIVFGDLPIASKVAGWVLKQPQLELLGAVLSNPNAHNHDPWQDVPMFEDFCNKEQVPLYTLDGLKSSFTEGEIDLGLFCRFSKIVKRDIISLFRLGIINMHGGLLPEFAGPYSSNYSVLFGSKKGGGTLHWVDEGIDTGDIIKRCEFEILSDDTGFSVFQKTQEALYENMVKVIMPILRGEWKGYTKQKILLEQGYGHRYFKLGSLEEYKEIKKDMSEEEASRVIRACDFPGYEPAWVKDKNGKKIYLRYHYE